MACHIKCKVMYYTTSSSPYKAVLRFGAVAIKHLHLIKAWAIALNITCPVMRRVRRRNIHQYGCHNATLEPLQESLFFFWGVQVACRKE